MGNNYVKLCDEKLKIANIVDGDFCKELWCIKNNSEVITLTILNMGDYKLATKTIDRDKYVRIIYNPINNYIYMIQNPNTMEFYNIMNFAKKVDNKYYDTKTSKIN